MTTALNSWCSSSAPEFLINHKTHTCLAVVEGIDAHDAIIGMQRCTGIPNQQWFPADGQWQWGGNRKLCLAPKGKNDLQLAPCDSVSSSWAFDEEGRLLTGSRSLGVRVAQPSKPVKLWEQKGGANKRWWTYTGLKSMLEDTVLTEHSFPAEVMAICKKEMNIVDPPKKKNRRRRKKHCLRGEDSSDTENVCEIDNFDTDDDDDMPDYLISQRNYKCLTVIEGSSPEDGVIGMAPYTGCLSQQWFVNDGHWEWGGNRDLCLVPDWENGKVGLAACNSGLTPWTVHESGLMLVDSHALEVPQSGSETDVFLHPVHDSLGQKWWTLSGLKPYVGKKLYPFSPQGSPIYRHEIMRGLVNMMTPLCEPLPYPRAVSHFPGAVAPSTPRVNRIVPLDLQNTGQRKGLRMRAPPHDWQATGLYVAAGDVFSIILPESTTLQQASQIKVRVGAQTDTLSQDSKKIKKGRKLRRMPTVSEVFDIKPGPNLLRSQYGGNLIFIFRSGENFEVIAEVHNVVETPHYIINKTTDDEWEKMKQLETPYSVLEGERVVLVVPTNAAKKTQNPELLLQRYDNVVSIIEDLSGFDENDPPPRGKHWLVDDIQISAGSAHAGFPTMFERKSYNLAALATPHSWVVWHELGHNYQQPKFWSTAYGTESTVNLFSLYVQERLTGGHRFQKNRAYAKFSETVDQGMTFQEGKSGGKLTFLMEIQNAYPEHGWDMFRHLKRTTRALSPEEAKKVKSNTQNQFDHVYKVLSQYIGVDLLPHYQRWSISISQKAQEHIKMLGLRKISGDLAVRK